MTQNTFFGIPVKGAGYFAITVLIAAIATPGCTSSDKEQTPAAPSPVKADIAAAESENAIVAATDLPDEFDELSPSILNKVYFEVDDFLLAGKTNEANAVFTNAFTDPEYDQVKDRLFGSMMRFFIYTRQYETAQSVYLNALRLTPDIAEPGFDTIYGAYLNEGDYAKALTWARVLTTQEIPERLRPTAAIWLIDSLVRTDSKDEAAREIIAALAEFPANTLAGRFTALAQEEVAAGDSAFAAKIFAAITSSRHKDAPEFKAMTLTFPIRLAAAAGEWDKVAVTIAEIIAEVPDQPLLQAVNFANQTARRAKNTEAVEKIASAIILDERSAAKEQTRNTAAREWVGVLFAAGTDSSRKTEYPARLAKLIQIKLPARQIYGIFSRYFYEILGDEDREILKEVVPIADSIYPMLADESSQETLTSHLLDASFLLNDYERALSILEKGFKDREEDWHKIAIVKVKAHIALSKNETDAAVALFREFMGMLKDEDTADPVTDVVYGKSTLLGDNEKRIGDIYAAADRNDEAAAAYAAAKAHYETALQAEKISDATKAYIEGQIKAVE